MKFIFYVFWIFVVLLGVSFSAINTQLVTINYYINHATVQLPILSVILIAFGAVLGVIAMMPGLLRSKRKIRSLKHQVKELT